MEMVRSMKKITPAAILMAGLLMVGAMEIAQADQVMFTPKWKALEFFRIPATEYKMEGATVEITARQSSSVTYSPLHKADWSATKAAWDWDTRQSVPPTNLAEKGNDDRNIAIYFVFLDKKVAEKIGQTASLRRLLTSRSARIIVYAFGGDKPVNTVEPNPYLGDRGILIIKRRATVGAFSENVDLRADYERAFKGAPGALVGIALASDSDNTGKVVIASVSNLVVQ